MKRQAARKAPASPAAAGESPAETPETASTEIGVLEPQPHGGALWRGPSPNVTPGPGRPSALFQAGCRAALNRVDALGWVCSVIRGEVEGATVADQQRAVDFLARYGIGVPKDVDREDERPQFDSQEEVIARGRELVPRLLPLLFPGHELRPVDPTDPPATFVPALAPFIGATAPLALLMKYGWDKLAEANELQKAAHSLTGILAQAQVGDAV